jgi:hypothetical protein
LGSKNVNGARRAARRFVFKRLVTSALIALKRKRPKQSALIDEAVRQSEFAESDLCYLPLASEHRTDWSVAIGLRDGVPKLYLPVDAW